MVPQPDGTLIQRPPLQRLATAVTGNILAAGSLRKRDGTVVDWIFTDTPTIYSVVSGAPSSQVSAANFASASVAPSTSTAGQWTTASDATKDYIAFGDALVPWLWDGSSGAA